MYIVRVVFVFLFVNLSLVSCDNEGVKKELMVDVFQKDVDPKEKETALSKTGIPLLTNDITENIKGDQITLFNSDTIDSFSDKHEVVTPNTEHSLLNNIEFSFVSKSYYDAIPKIKSFSKSYPLLKNDSFFILNTSKGKKKFLSYKPYQDYGVNDYEFMGYSSMNSLYSLRECGHQEWTFCELLIIDSITNKSFSISSDFSDFGFYNCHLSNKGTYMSTYLNDRFGGYSYIFLCKTEREEGNFSIKKHSGVKIDRNDFEEQILDYENKREDIYERGSETAYQEELKELKTKIDVRRKLTDDIDEYEIKELKWIDNISFVIELDVSYKQKSSRTLYLKSIID